MKSCALGLDAHAVAAPTAATISRASRGTSPCRPRDALHATLRVSLAARPCHSTPEAIGSTGRVMAPSCSIS